MSPKKRVYDLAKEYGMTGQDLAAKLRDLGFAQIKSHMTALGDFEVMEIQGRLEAYGIVGESTETTASTMPGGLKIKRKRKKKLPEADTPPTQPPVEDKVTDAAPEPEPEPEPEPAPAAAPVAEEVVPEPEPAPAVEAEPETPEPIAVIPAPEAEEAVAEADPVEATAEGTETAPEEPAAEPQEPEAAVAEPEPVVEVAPEPAPVVPEVAAETGDAPAEEADSSVEESAPAQAQAADTAKTEAQADTKPEGDAAAEAEDAKAGPGVVRPSAQRRQAKVVGFIDLSQIQTTPPKPVSRRLRSSDDVAPDVRPTLGRDKSQAFARGDQGARGGLTAAQLRDRETQRFKRRTPMGGGRRGGGGSSRGRSGGSQVVGSPYAGQTVKLEAPITVKKLSDALAVKNNELLKVSWSHLGFGAVQINSPLDEDTAVLLAAEYEVELDVVQEVEAEDQLISELEEKRAAVEEEQLIKRPPTVAFLGHVDHGKTTLIDTIRKSQITDAESGGITQHIGAYQIETSLGHTLTVLDTPGHAAFTSMRARGAKAVDVVVLVIAADDGVKPQTEEAINHAKAAGTPIVVAMNKMDKMEANPERLLSQLSALELQPEEWGGDTAILPISALKGDGIEDLLERVFLEGEVLELDCHPEGPARGVVLEAEIQQGRGKIAHLLVQDGCLKRGDVILAGDGYGKVRSIHNDRGKQIQEAGPSSPVEVTGLNELPGVGDTFYVVDALDQAQEVAEERNRKSRQLSQIERRAINSQNLLAAVVEQDKSIVNLILKTDVQGSAEVLKHQLAELVHDEVDVKVVHSGVGQVVESDVDLAITSEAIILAFHVGTATKARQAAERGGVEIRNYEIIYQLLDDVRKMMEGSLAPEIVENITGHVEIRRLFKSSRIGNIAGCYVLDGKIHRDNSLRILRDGKVIHTGKFASLKRESDDAKDVREGFECGIVVKNYDDIRVGDVLETFRLVEVKRTI